MAYYRDSFTLFFCRCPSSVDINNELSFTSTPPYVLYWYYLKRRKWETDEERDLHSFRNVIWSLGNSRRNTLHKANSSNTKRAALHNWSFVEMSHLHFRRWAIYLWEERIGNCALSRLRQIIASVNVGVYTHKWESSYHATYRVYRSTCS
jgi:hypothetical protein